MSLRSARSGPRPSVTARPPQNGSTRRRWACGRHNGSRYEICQRLPPAHLSGGDSEAGMLAEGEGFEPPEPLPVQWFSRPPPSTTRPSLPPSLARIPRASFGAASPPCPRVLTRAVRRGASPFYSANRVLEQSLPIHPLDGQHDELLDR